MEPGRIVFQKICIDWRSRIFDLTSHFQNGGYDVISHRKVLLPGVYVRCLCSSLKAKIHYTSFPVASPQHKRQVCNKLARTSPLCRVVFQIPLQRLVANMLAASPSTGKLRGNVSNVFWAYANSWPIVHLYHSSRIRFFSKSNKRDFLRFFEVTCQKT